MYGEYKNIKIAGIQAAAPRRTIDNLELAGKVGSKRARKFVEYTGINRRHLVDVNQSASDLSSYAADKLLDRLRWDRNDIRVIVNVTQSADLRTPSTAMIIQKRLGIGTDCLAFDVNLGCSAYPSGLQIMAALLQNTGGKGLLLVGDGKYCQPPEKLEMDSLLFGDGAAATAIEIDVDNPMFYSQNTDGSRFELLYSPWSGGIVMDGNAILLLALNEVIGSINRMKAHFSIQDDDIDYYVFHQAQKLIIDGISEQGGFTNAKVLRSYEEYGNTSTATLPITLCHNAELLKTSGKKSRFLLCGFGVGLTWTSVIIDIDPDVIFPVIETDHRYMDLPIL